MNDTAKDERATPPEHARDHFAWLRTRFAVERTLMAWVRTSTALIAFGFSIVTFFDQLGRMTNVHRARLPAAPRVLGLGLIALGTLALVIALFQFRTFVRYLRGTPFAAIAEARRTPGQRPLVAISIAIIAVGFAAFLLVLVRVV